IVPPSAVGRNVSPLELVRDTTPAIGRNPFRGVCLFIRCWKSAPTSVMYAFDI
ncbi:hypothetical protein GW17_00052994, partial [Ensete ventricosum]